MIEPSQSMDEVLLSTQDHIHERYLQVAPSIEWIGSEDHYDHSGGNELYLVRDNSSNRIGGGSGGVRDRRLSSFEGEGVLIDEENGRVIQSETYDDYDLPMPTGMSTGSSKMHRKPSRGPSSFDKGICRASSIAEGEREREEDDENEDSEKKGNEDDDRVGDLMYGRRTSPPVKGRDIKSLQARGGTPMKALDIGKITSDYDDDNSFSARAHEDYYDHEHAYAEMVDRSKSQESDSNNDYSNNYNHNSNNRFEARVRVKNKSGSSSSSGGVHGMIATSTSSSGKQTSTIGSTWIGGKNQDYLALARLYKIQRPYSDPNYQALCLLCHREFCEDVFFPCEHHCVCRKCIKREKIIEENKLKSIPDGFCNCSLCAGIIKRIIPLDGGREVEKYWEWVYEEKVELPIGFMRNWRHSAAVIQKIYIDEKYQNYGTEGVSSFCSIS